MHMEQNNNFNSQWHKHTSNPHPQHHYSTHYSESLLPYVEYSSVCVQAARTCGPNSLIMVMMLACCLKCGAVSMYGGLFETVILISRKHVVKHMTINQVAINHQ